MTTSVISTEYQDNKPILDRIQWLLPHFILFEDSLTSWLQIGDTAISFQFQEKATAVAEQNIGLECTDTMKILQLDTADF